MSAQSGRSLDAPRSRGAAPAGRGAERAEHRGQLKIFLGYASGVGKSFKLFDEGRRRRERGEDVVVAAMQPDSTPEVAQVIRGARSHSARRMWRAFPSSTCPRSSLGIRTVCLVDGLAYDNPPGSRHRKRYEDVEELLAAGISVITSINLEYIAEQQDFVRGVLGTTKTDTVPQAFIDRADEVVVVDAPPDADAGVEATSAVAASPARAAADGRCRRSAARSSTFGCTASNRPGARRSGFWCA